MKLDPKRTIFFQIVNMDRYDGSDTDFFAGFQKTPLELGIAAELMNFRKQKDHCYGYMANFNKDESSKEIELSHYGAKSSDKHVDGMTVIWIAPSRQGGKEVVGWYQNATVYRKAQFPRGSLAKARTHDLGGSEPMPYFASCAASDAVILEPDQRTLLLPSTGKGLPGTSRVYHPGNNTGKSAADSLLERVGSFIFTADRNKKTKSAKKKRVDAEKNKHVEIEAVRLAEDYYGDGKYKYKVKSVEKDNLGYDLVARKDNKTLCVEVKGRSGSKVAADFSPNETRAIRKAENGKFKDGEYRICIVTKALSGKPVLREFQWIFRNGEMAWCSQDSCVLNMKEVVALRATASC